VVELLQAVAHLFVCLNRAVWESDDDDDLGCRSNADIDALTTGR
jgi:hypothetical protein